MSVGTPPMHVLEQIHEQPVDYISPHWSDIIHFRLYTNLRFMSNFIIPMYFQCGTLFAFPNNRFNPAGNLCLPGHWSIPNQTKPPINSNTVPLS